MKSILFFFLLALSTFTLQSQNIEGTYSNKWVSNSGEGLAYELTLHPEGNFTFIYKRMHLDSNPDTEVEVMGTWIMDGHLLILNTNTLSEADNKLASGLNLNKARFVSISPRNPKFNLVKPTLKFYESAVFYAKDMELIKTESSLTGLE